MKFRVSLSLALLSIFACPVAAKEAGLPPIKADAADNAVPACVTPGRLMAFLKARNTALDPSFDGVATEYMRHGEQLGLRWDYAFFQMIVETGYLTFKRGNGGWGDVKPRQNNFAGLGATGGGVPGESFPDVSTGVLAHLQHVAMYSGEHIDNPVAERTRKVQEWGVLRSWHRSMAEPITFTQLTRKWSPNDSTYAGSIAATANRFFDGFCNRPDPHPELVHEARGGRDSGNATQAAEWSEPVSGRELARRAQQEGDQRAALGAANVANGAVPFKVLNSEPEEAATPAQAPAVAAEKAMPFQTASAAASGKLLAIPSGAPMKPGKCRVWTASYGGQKAMIIRATAGDITNFTVLDVNEGSEKREAEAYIAAYAKGGVPVGEFASQPQALDKAFELCPEG